MVKKIKKESEYVPIEQVSPQQIIAGAFVWANRVIQSKVQQNPFWIKLSSITTIVPQFKKGETTNECVFYTYKDCCYFVPISDQDLRHAVNSFLFLPEEHLDVFGC